MKREKGTCKNLIIGAALMYAAVMVAFPSVTEAGSKSAIAIWANSIVPVLLPFFIFADFIKRSADMERLPIRVYPFVMAFLSGYPMGAKITGDLVKQGAMSRAEGEFVLSYSLVTGPAFILGTIGTFLGNPRAAAIVALAHYMGAVCNGWLYRYGAGERPTRKSSGDSADDASHRAIDQYKKNSYLDNFTDAILAGFKAMAIILAYLIMFMIGTELLETLGIFSVLPGEQWAAFVKGLLEMTMGTSALGMCNVGMKLKVVLTAFLVSFGGLSVIGQSVSMAGGSGLDFVTIVKLKLTHGLLAGVIAALMVTSF